MRKGNKNFNGVLGNCNEKLVLALHTPSPVTPLIAISVGSWIVALQQNLLGATETAAPVSTKTKHGILFNKTLIMTRFLKLGFDSSNEAIFSFPAS